MKRNWRVVVRLSEHEVARLDEHRGVRSRAAYLRELLTQPPPAPIATHQEAIRMLLEQARAGRASAAIALEKALRPSAGPPPPEPMDEVDRILDGDDAWR